MRTDLAVWSIRDWHTGVNRLPSSEIYYIAVKILNGPSESATWLVNRCRDWVIIVELILELSLLNFTGYAIGA